MRTRLGPRAASAGNSVLDRVPAGKAKVGAGACLDGEACFACGADAGTSSPRLASADDWLEGRVII